MKDKQIWLTDVAGYGFDMRVSMGTVFRDQGKISFHTLNNIREAYRLAFKLPAESIFNSNADIVKVEKTRHLIAHKGGIVDKKFVEDTREFFDYRNAVVGEYLPMNGPRVCVLLNASVKISTANAPPHHVFGQEQRIAN